MTGARAPEATELVLLERNASETEGRARWTVVPGRLYFEGHFPGRPVLPAVAQLDLVQRALAAVLGRAISISVVERLRCARPVLPGEELALDLEWSEALSSVRFALRHGNDRVSDGVVACRADLGGTDGG